MYIERNDYKIYSVTEGNTNRSWISNEAQYPTHVYPKDLFIHMNIMTCHIKEQGYWNCTSTCNTIQCVPAGKYFHERFKILFTEFRFNYHSINNLICVAKI